MARKAAKKVTRKARAQEQEQEQEQEEAQEQERTKKKSSRKRVGKTPTNAEINAVRALRNQLRDKALLRTMTKKEEETLEFYEQQLYAMRRAYHAMLARRKAS